VRQLLATLAFYVSEGSFVGPMAGEEMLGSALYFPHIDIRDPAWLRSTLLFWDDIHTIVPSSIDSPYQSDDTKVCFKEGILKPLHCDLHPDIIDELGQKVIALGDGYGQIERQIRHMHPSLSESLRASDGFNYKLEDAFFEVGMHPDKMSPELRHLVLRLGLTRMNRGKIPPRLRAMLRDVETARIHPEKLPYALRELFEDRWYRDADCEWLLVNSHFADAYMSALAARLSNQLLLSPLTSENSAHGMSFRFLFDDVVDRSPRSAPGALMTVAMRGLAVDASVPISKIIDFKRARRDQYIEFKSQVDELAALISSEDILPDELIESAKAIYEQKIDRSLRQLKRELDHQSISSMWEGAFTAVTVSASSTTALAYFTQLTGPALLGVGATLALATVGVRGYLAGRKLRINNPYSYLHDLKANFGLPEFS